MPGETETMVDMGGMRLQSFLINGQLVYLCNSGCPG